MKTIIIAIFTIVLISAGLGAFLTYHLKPPVYQVEVITTTTTEYADEATIKIMGEDGNEYIITFKDWRYETW